MALPKIGFNEGSLLRRTLLHVGTFVAGSIAFIGLMSFVLVTVAHKLVAAPAPETDDDEPAAVATAAPAVATSPTPPRRPKAKARTPRAPKAAPVATDD